MRVSVNVKATVEPTTGTPATTVLATPETITVPVATPTTILVDGRAFIVGENCFRIFTNAESADDSYHFADVGNGVWLNEESGKKLVGFCITTCNQQYHVVITEEFDWEEFFSLPIKPKGKFDGTEWDGTIENSVRETCNFRCKFIYTQDESYSYMKRAFEKKEVKVINSVEELLHLFGRFNDFMHNEGVRAKNPFL